MNKVWPSKQTQGPSTCPASRARLGMTFFLFISASTCRQVRPSGYIPLGLGGRFSRNSKCLLHRVCGYRISLDISLIVIHQEIGNHRFGAELSQQCCDLSPVIGRVIDYVDHLLP
jgi:hypothetical protein